MVLLRFRLVIWNVEADRFRHKILECKLGPKTAESTPRLSINSATSVGLCVKFKILPRPVGKLSRYLYCLHQMVKIFFLHSTNLGDYRRDKHVI
jgi:hypothetical protein